MPQKLMNGLVSTIRAFDNVVSNHPTSFSAIITAFDLLVELGQNHVCLLLLSAVAEALE